MHQVDEQTFDMRAVMISVRHQHDGTAVNIMDPEVVLHVGGLDVDATALRAFDDLELGLDQLVRRMHHVRAAVNGVEGVHHADLLQGLPIVISKIWP